MLTIFHIGIHQNHFTCICIYSTYTSNCWCSGFGVRYSYDLHASICFIPFWVEYVSDAFWTMSTQRQWFALKFLSQLEQNGLRCSWEKKIVSCILVIGINRFRGAGEWKKWEILNCNGCIDFLFFLKSKTKSMFHFIPFEHSQI